MSQKPTKKDTKEAKEQHEEQRALVSSNLEHAGVDVEESSSEEKKEYALEYESKKSALKKMDPDPYADTEHTFIPIKQPETGSRTGVISSTVDERLKGNVSGIKEDPTKHKKGCKCDCCVIL